MKNVYVGAPSYRVGAPSYENPGPDSAILG